MDGVGVKLVLSAIVSVVSLSESDSSKYFREMEPKTP